MKKTTCESKKEGRIINVSSDGHNYTYPEGIRFDKINDESSYQRWKAYGQSKLANILHANELARHLKEDGVDITANSLHPGCIYTNIVSPEGAATTCYVALNPQVKGISGKYFSDSNVDEPSSQATDIDLAKKLWDFSMKLIE
ncbi:hypothetical protein TSUD_352480 [Trifolium subterraneum]|nr:hypothetical protein TSUD_352480 [Trifolium subterraneum]